VYVNTDFAHKKGLDEQEQEVGAELKALDPQAEGTGQRRQELLLRLTALQKLRTLFPPRPP
jgi:hypothetical protein